MCIPKFNFILRVI